MDIPILCIIICTYNREELLLQCLESLHQQTYNSDNWKILIVNNYHESFDERVIKCISSISNASFINKNEPGLSVARNAGIQNSKSEWIALLDDDAIVPSDYVDRILDIIQSDSFDCFGGGINSWWHFGRPRWLNENFGSKPNLRSDRGEISEGYNWGSNIMIKRSALEHVGGFPEYIGMSGTHIGYSAENLVQDRLREHGYRIGYDPDLVIDHVVAKHKLNMSWHIQAAYATGRDGRQVFRDQYGMAGMFKSLKSCITRPVRSLLQFFIEKKYPWQKVYLEFMTPWALFLGKLRSLF